MINGRYKIVKKTGSGRSHVFICEDKANSNKELAIKVLSNYNDVDDLSSFRNEYKILRRADHPNIIKAIEFGTVLESGNVKIPRGSRFFTLEYFPGKNLLSVNDCSETSLIGIIVQISSLLYYLHQSNYIYYDLKPENILIKWTDEKPLIKIIDFGLARKINGHWRDSISGTTEYIAPEILRKEKHDHRVDLYSFGMLLYRLIYKKFPFNNLNDINIYKAHIEDEFEYPETIYSDQILRIVKKLLSKKPEDRYNNSIEILYEIDASLIRELSKDWVPARVFTDRTDVCSILKTYINDSTSGEIFAVKGSEGAGKSSLLNRIASNYKEAVLVAYTKAKPGFEFIKEFLGKTLYNENIYNSIPDNLKQKIKRLITTPTGDIIVQVKAIFSRLSQECSFIILFDNFNDMDELVYEVVSNIIPIMQVNNRKFILAEDPDIRNLSKNIFNLREINLTSFTESNLKEFVEVSYYNRFPREELKKLILLYADLLPGNIQGFIRDIHILDVIDYTHGLAIISNDEGIGKLLQSSHDEIYELRISTLYDDELMTAEIVSLFEIPIDQKTVSIITGFTQEGVDNITFALMQKNILLPLHITNLLNFTSAGLKNFIYNQIEDKVALHSRVAETIRSEVNEFNKSELARQFEQSYRFKDSYEVIKLELTEAEKISAFSYMKKILRRYQSLPLGFDDKSDIKSALVPVLYNLSEFKNSEELIDELLIEPLSKEKKDELLILKASCLIGSGNCEDGKNLLDKLIVGIREDEKIQKLLQVTANAEFELNNFANAKAICLNVINNSMSGNAEKGNCYNLLGLISIIAENNLGEGLKYLELAENVYKQAGLLHKVAQMEMNMGNIYNIKGEHKEAEEYWNKSLDLTLSIGNLELEAKLLLNFGIYYFEKPSFETAMEYYNRALSIFVSLGNSSGQGLVQHNIAETYLLTCEYGKAIDAIGNSIKMSASLKNQNELLESLFLYGKICFAAGDQQTLKIIINQMSEMIKDEKVIEKHHINYRLLNLLYSEDSVDTIEFITSLKILGDWYLQNEDKNNYFFAAVYIIRYMIRIENYDAAFIELEAESFTKLCSENKLNNAEKNYLEGVVALNKDSIGNPIDLLLDTFGYISEFSITELTWQVMFKLSVIYYERGNFSKSKEFNIYAVSVLDYIYNNIKSSKIRRIVMEQADRKEAYSKLKSMQKYY